MTLHLEKGLYNDRVKFQASNGIGLIKGLNMWAIRAVVLVTQSVLSVEPFQQLKQLNINISAKQISETNQLNVSKALLGFKIFIWIINSHSIAALESKFRPCLYLLEIIYFLYQGMVPAFV